MIRFRVSEQRVTLGVNDDKIRIGVADVVIHYKEKLEEYEGSYTVTPKTEKQTMHTKNKKMTDDVEIMEIPYFEVGNTSGGNTVYIGSEV